MEGMDLGPGERPADGLELIHHRAEVADQERVIAGESGGTPVADLRGSELAGRSDPHVMSADGPTVQVMDRVPCRAVERFGRGTVGIWIRMGCGVRSTGRPVGEQGEEADGGEDG